MDRAESLKKTYQLAEHREGGYFSEVYTAPFMKDGRPLAGSIYYLLNRREISHFHEIDCDEIWYYHEGCGMKITMLMNGAKEEYLLGGNTDRGDRAMVVIPKGAVFAAENLDADGYTFISCATVPHFRYSDFRLVHKEELREKYGGILSGIEYLAY